MLVINYVIEVISVKSEEIKVLIWIHSVVCTTQLWLGAVLYWLIDIRLAIVAFQIYEVLRKLQTGHRTSSIWWQ